MIGRHRRRAIAALAGAAELAALVVWLAPARASAGLLVEQLRDEDPCAEAATFAESDQSPEARRAYRRCRLAWLDRSLAEQRRHEAEERARRRPQVIQAWMERQSIPTRVMRRNAIDGFVGGGVVNYGLTLAGVFLPSLEGEAWVGWGSGDAFVNSAQVSDDRRCLGGRAKWMTLQRFNLTPYLSGGVAFCQASLKFSDFGGGNFVTSDGDGTAHHVTASAGLSWTAQNGFRASFEWMYMRAFYVQARHTDAMVAHDPTMRAVFESSLKDDRHGVRFQVGYAF